MRGSTAGIGDGLQGISSKYFNFLTFLDQVISTIIVTPLVVGYWRGTWGCMDYFAFNNDIHKSALVSVIIGSIGSFIFAISQNYFIEKYHSNINSLKYYLITRLYTACFGIVCVNQFRGTWVCLDLYTPHTITAVSTITLISIIILIITKTLRNLSAPPFALSVDRYEDYFTVPTFFKYSSDRVCLYFLDCMFSICVIGTLVVFVWRGTWCVLDLLLYPSKPVTSAFASTVIGYVLVLITFSLQSVMKYLARTLTGISRLLVVDIYLLFSFCGTVNVWRGIWNLLNYYFLPEMPSASFLLTHVLSFVLLVSISSANSIIVRGVYIDGEEKGDLCVEFPCYYTRLFYQARRQRKLLRECEKIRKGNKQNGEIETVAILPQDSKKPVTILPMVQNNNEINQPMV